jgi:hypothetical protein
MDKIQEAIDDLTLALATGGFKTAEVSNGSEQLTRIGVEELTTL